MVNTAGKPVQLGAVSALEATGQWVVRTALISVSDKQGIVPFAQFLHARGVKILSTGGTAALLQKTGIPVIRVSDHTGAPEMMEGRVKTLHPVIHAGILARPGIDDAVLQEKGMASIDMVVVNLYPFAAVTAQADCTHDMAIEHIDIGGPTLLRAAAKNHAKVTVLVDPGDYRSVMKVATAVSPSSSVETASESGGGGVCACFFAGDFGTKSLFTYCGL